MLVEQLRTYKSSLYNSSDKELSEFERNFLFVSTGTLAFTLTFIHQTTPLEKSVCLGLLLSSWFLILLSISLMFLTYWKSAKLSQKIFDEVDRYLEAQQLFDDKFELSIQQVLEVRGTVNGILVPGKKTLWGLRRWCIGLFLVGLTLISIFVVLNIFHIYK